MSREEKAGVAAAAFVLFSGYHLLKQNRKKKTKNISSFKKSRSRRGGSYMLADFVKEPSRGFENFCRMSTEDYEYLLNKIGVHIARSDTNMRKCIPIQERFAIALRFLASGDSYTSLGCLFKVSIQTVSRCVDDVCRALVQELSPDMKLPRTSSDWLKIEEDFSKIWNFPHCLGALDGKHLLTYSPTYSSSEFINCHSTFSVVLLALVDADYNFIFVDCGGQGRISDGGVYRNTQLYKKISRNELDLPPADCLPLKETPLPYVFVADSAFSLSETIMKPYGGTHNKGSKERVFNYRLSRARRVVENVFGIMSAVFRVLRRPMLLQPDKATDIIMSCALLHNFLRRSEKSKSLYTPIGTFDTELDGVIQPGSWRNDRKGITSLKPLRKIPRRAALSAKDARDHFAEFFTTNGAVEWQNND